jgi:hypothetical protein
MGADETPTPSGGDEERLQLRSKVVMAQLPKERTRLRGVDPHYCKHPKLISIWKYKAISRQSILQMPRMWPRDDSDRICFIHDSH